MGDQLRFVDDSGDTRLAGELVDDGATVGDVLTVQSDGSLAAAAGGGPSAPDNWANIAIGGAPTLNADNAWNWIPAFSTNDLSIDEQSGSDFSIADNGSDQAQVVSAAGGWFQFGGYFGAPAGVTLDGGSTLNRYLTLAALCGVNGPLNPFSSLGIDAYVPFDGASPGGAPSCSPISVPAYVAPGGPVLWNLIVAVYNATGTDVITQPLSGLFGLSIWQIPDLT